MTTARLPTVAMGVILGLTSAAVQPLRVEAKGCGFNECGTNSAEIRGTSINGLSVAGAVNAEGVRLVPQSLTLFPNLFTMPSVCWGRSGYGFGLAVAGGALVATTHNPGEVLPTECLLGATFQMDVPVALETGGTITRRVTLKIAQRGSVSTWHASLARRLLTTYELIDVEKNASVCTPSQPWMEPWQIGGIPPDHSNPAGIGGARWHTFTDHALIVQGESYTAAAGIDAQRRGSEWFNIACAGSALAKSRLMGYDPMSTTSTSAQRQSTLKMLTAHYVRDNAQSWTQTGTPLIWVSTPANAYYGGADPALVTGPIEARWNGDGATCVSHLRLWNTSTTVASELDTLTTIRRLGGRAACSTSAPTDIVWTTTTVDHVD